MNTINLSEYDIPVKLTPEYILSKVDDIYIFRYYLGAFDMNTKVKNPFRKDIHPSFSIYINNDSLRLKWKDFGTNESGDCFTLVSKLFNLSFVETLQKIAEDFGLVKGKRGITGREMQAVKVFKETLLKKEFKIQVETRPYTGEELNYWDQFSITKKELISNSIIPIKKLWINGNIVSLSNHMHFAYYFPKVEKFKIYSPLDPDKKWFGNVSTKYIEGLDKEFDYSKPIIISKSRKDRMCLSHFLPNVVNTQNESSFAISEKEDEFFLKKFPSAYIIWDSDSTGVQECTKLNKRGYKYFNVPNDIYKNTGCKDYSDLIRFFGEKKAQEIIIDVLSKKHYFC